MHDVLNLTTIEITAVEITVKVVIQKSFARRQESYYYVQIVIVILKIRIVLRNIKNQEFVIL